ncbi:TRAP transporter large permease [Bacillus swezeyi]|uniref:TRAP C4-dicarboxylate transport system permease DctM subunit domain-containing protein n=1 Tax=Bacillus swezeyi TaxID=1925020 RepID=A0A1R1RM70_9BACI|nr:TRAP transporter large permease [Bacillus swezeyi]MEC1262979.1 TRAP transporter large permease [Bacillus swezeyi]MED2929990.1 TRAP transporter large permease [Bacillus swezeyi]MED2944949.1 TRAP transporter large permease [Bacillus swezeyi]MED2963119.1 TRAP transporter large permease [Bacillus swezeyi]MED2976173.1 TRAP transporter large permease [Bacillus swezeyi]
MILQASLILVLVFAVLLAVGIPIAISIAVSSLATILLILPIDIAVFSSAQKMVASIDSFSLIAVPFFILSGIIMNNGGIAAKLVDFSKLLAGRVPGSLSHTNVIGNSLFGSISSSAIAASTAIGGVMVPLQEKEGYDRKFAAAVNIASAPAGMVIPPSTGFIIFSLISGGTSIAALFMGGYVVGVLWALAIMIVSYIIAKKRKYPVVTEKTNLNVKKIVWEAVPSILLIFIIIGGILTGVFTAVEASAIAVVYSFILAFFFYKTITLKQLPHVMAQAVEMTGVIMLLIAASSLMSFAMAFTGIPAALSSLVLGISDNPIIILLVMNLVLLLIGTVMDVAPAILIFTPIFMPIATGIGIDPVHFGIFFILNLCVGTITPPVGTGLFVGSSVGKVKIEQVLKPLLPFYAAIFVLLMLVTYFPQISLFLPNLLGL